MTISRSVGFVYTLPMFVNYRPKCTKMARRKGEFMANTDKGNMIGLRYIFTGNLGIRTHYDSDRSFGAGLMLSY